MLVLGSALYANAEAEAVHDGDILNAGTNISVTKDDTTKTITISTDGVATSAEVDAVKTDVQKNQTAIADNTDKIAEATTIWRLVSISIIPIIPAPVFLSCIRIPRSTGRKISAKCP